MITEAIAKLRPNSTFSIKNDDYSTLKWCNPDTKPPTEKEINAKITELKAEYKATQYQRDRADAYPSWQTQMDQLFHQGYDGWKAEVQKVKDQFPKP